MTVDAWQALLRDGMQRDATAELAEAMRGVSPAMASTLVETIILTDRKRRGSEIVRAGDTH